MNVLIVGGNEAVADLLAELLEDGHRVRTTYSARQALEKVKEGAFDVAWAAFIGLICQASRWPRTFKACVMPWR